MFSTYVLTTDFFNNIATDINNTYNYIRTVDTNPSIQSTSNNGGHMQVTSINPNQQEAVVVATRWLTRVLETPTLELNATFPNECKSILYVGGNQKVTCNGSWQIDSEHIYLRGRSAQVDQFTRLSILAAIAGTTRAIEQPGMVDLISRKLITILQDSTRSIYNSIIASTHRPTRLAIDHQGLQIAAELNGRWLTTSGVPVEVSESWTIMDF